MRNIHIQLLKSDPEKISLHIPHVDDPIRSINDICSRFQPYLDWDTFDEISMTEPFGYDYAIDHAIDCVTTDELVSLLSTIPPSIKTLNLSNTFFHLRTSEEIRCLLNAIPAGCALNVFKNNNTKDTDYSWIDFDKKKFIEEKINIETLKEIRYAKIIALMLLICLVMSIITFVSILLAGTLFTTILLSSGAPLPLMFAMGKIILYAKVPGFVFNAIKKCIDFFRRPSWNNRLNETAEKTARKAIFLEYLEKKPPPTAELFAALLRYTQHIEDAKHKTVNALMSWIMTALSTGSPEGNPEEFRIAYTIAKCNAEISETIITELIAAACSPFRPDKEKGMIIENIRIFISNLPEATREETVSNVLENLLLLKIDSCSDGWPSKTQKSVLAVLDIASPETRQQFINKHPLPDGLPDEKREEPDAAVGCASWTIVPNAPFQLQNHGLFSSENSSPQLLTPAPDAPPSAAPSICRGND